MKQRKQNTLHPHETRRYFWIRNWSRIAIPLVVGTTTLQPDPKSPTLRRFRWHRDDIWPDCS